MHLLDVSGLQVSYGPSVVLSDIDMVVPDGSVVGILGANGAGKSSLLKAVAGLVRPTAGSITFDGERIDGLEANQIARRGICLLPEGRGILPALTVGDNLKLAFRGDQNAIDAIVARFPVLGERLNQPAGTMSGGEQQMLTLSRAFSAGTRLLLVDEPSLGLAPRLVNVVERILRDLHDQQGRTIVWVEQYASRVLALADIVYVVARGRVAWAGEPSELRGSKVLVRNYLGGTG